MTPDGIYFAENEQERRAIEALRFRRLIKEMKLHFPSADYKQRQLPLPGDNSAKLIYLLEGQEVTGSLRLSIQAQSSYTPRQMEIFDPTLMDPFVPLEFTAIQDMIVLKRLPQKAHQEVIIRMFRFALQYLGQHKVTLLMTACRETEQHFYKDLGFRNYKENHISLETGLLVPMGLFLPDLPYLQERESPLLGSYHIPLHQLSGVAW